MSNTYFKSELGQSDKIILSRISLIIPCHFKKCHIHNLSDLFLDAMVVVYYKTHFQITKKMFQQLELYLHIQGYPALGIWGGGTKSSRMKKQTNKQTHKFCKKVIELIGLLSQGVIVGGKISKKANIKN